MWNNIQAFSLSPTHRMFTSSTMVAHVRAYPCSQMSLFSFAQYSLASQNLVLPLGDCHNIFLRYAQSNLHSSFQNALRTFCFIFLYHFISEIDTFCVNIRFSICTKAKIQMSSRRKIMLTLFSLCYIALASTCQRKNFTYFHQKNNTQRLVPFIYVKELR